MRWRIVAVAVISIAVFGAPAAHASVIQLQPNNIGLVGYWSFNEGTSTIAHDFSGHGNSGTLSTTGSTLPQWVPGKFGTALSFDGSSSYIQASFSTLAPPVTMTAWIYPTTDSGIHAIISHDSNDNSGWRVGMIGSSLRFTLGGVADYSCGLNPTLNTWNFVAVVVSGNNGTRECYVNTSSSSGSIGTMSGSPNRVTIGTDYPGEVFQGKIDDVRIYNRALSATEVAGLYQSGAAKINSSQSPGTLSNGLVGWWTMDGADTVWSSATAGTEADRSGNGNTGTLNGMNRATSPVVGKIGQALNFTTGYITLPSSPVSNLAGPSSACAWVKDTNISAIPAGFAQTIFIFSDGLGNVLRMTDSETAVGESIDGGIIIGSTGGGEVITSSQQLFNNTWAFVCYTYSGSAWSIYVNGQSVATRGDSGIGLPTNNVIGARDTSGDGIWSGAIDDVRIYNRALSASEVQQLYLMGK
jgi:hypothetical protein